MAEEMTTEQKPTGDQSDGTGTPPVTPTEGAGDTPKPEDKSVPLAALTGEREKRQAAEAQLAKYREAEQKAADEKAKAAGDVDAAHKERDSFKAEAEAWRKAAQAELDALTEGLTDTQKAILEELGDDVPLVKRLGVAKKLTAEKPATEQQKLGGTGGGDGTNGKANSVLPAGITTKAQYHEAILSNDPEIQAILADPQKRATMRKEASRLT